MKAPPAPARVFKILPRHRWQIAAGVIRETLDAFYPGAFPSAGRPDTAEAENFDRVLQGLPADGPAIVRVLRGNLARPSVKFLPVPEGLRGTR